MRFSLEVELLDQIVLIPDEIYICIFYEEVDTLNILKKWTPFLCFGFSLHKKNYFLLTRNDMSIAVQSSRWRHGSMQLNLVCRPSSSTAQIIYLFIHFSQVIFGRSFIKDDQHVASILFLGYNWGFNSYKIWEGKMYSRGKS